jgi:uncharacterized protein (TIGR02246 family)
MWTRLSLLALSFLLIPGVVRAQANNPQDETAIRDIEAQWERAWNHHDAAALARLAAPDADFINARGIWTKGRDPVEKAQTEMQQTNERDSVWKTTEVDIRFLIPEVAIVHVYWVLSGERNAAGVTRQPQLGIFTRTEIKRDGRWLISASQATYVQQAS